jgi:hypothetical protein
MMTRQLQRLFNATTAFEYLVFVACFWIAQSILQATVNIELVFHSLLFSFVLLLSVRMIAPMLIKPISNSNLIFQRLCINAIGLLISVSILLLLGIFLASPYVATTILASFLVFFVLGTLSPLQSENTLTH